MYFVKILHSTAFRVMEEVQKERKSLKHQTACLIRLKKFWRQCSKTCFMTIYLSTTHDREKQQKIIVQFRIKNFSEGTSYSHRVGLHFWTLNAFIEN